MIQDLVNDEGFTAKIFQVDFALNKEYAFQQEDTEREIAGNCANSIVLPILTGKRGSIVMIHSHDSGL